MGRRLPAALVLVAIAAGAFALGRGSVHRAPARVGSGSFAAGREAAFGGFDGGWAYTTPYIVTLRRGGPGITYRFARRWTMLPGRDYRVCGRGICSRATRRP